MSDNRETEAGQAQTEEQPTYQSPWSAKAWEDARRAHNAGLCTPDPGFPIIIRAGSPLSTPADLQRLIGLAHVPELLTTTTAASKTYITENHVPEPVQVCSLTRSEKHDLLERTTYTGYEWHVNFRGKVRAAIEVISLEPGEIIGDDDDGVDVVLPVSHLWWGYPLSFTENGYAPPGLV
ncbi:hypothetical protein F4777DRAFT_580010 [Nemania sp. FL0916]|nr:hypothetical protein F4777DRAFT_580010 [Nemania sp. FL0916]